MIGYSDQIYDAKWHQKTAEADKQILPITEVRYHEQSASAARLPLYIQNQKRTSQVLGYRKLNLLVILEIIVLES